MMRHILFLIFSLYFVAAYSQQSQIDTLEKIVTADKEDTNKVRHLNTLTYLLRESGDIKKALETGAQSCDIAQKINYQRGLASAYNNIAGIYLDQANYKLALEYFNKALKIDEDNRYVMNEESTMGSMANVYISIGTLPKALELNLKALAMAEKINDTKGMAKMTMNIGNVYYYEYNDSLALAYYFKAIKLYEDSKNKFYEAYIFMYIGNVYERQKKYKDAKDYYKKTLAMIDENSNKFLYSACLANLGRVYKDEGNYSDAIENYTKSLNIEYTLGDRDGEAINYCNIGMVYIEQKKYQMAETYILKGLKISDSLGDFEFIKNDNESLSGIYEKTGRWQKAFEAEKKFKTANDSLFNDEKSKQIGRLEAKYQYDKDSAIQQANYANQIAIKQAEAEKKSAESKTQKIITGLVAFIALILILLIFQRLKGVEKEKLIAEQQKSWLELKALRTQMNPHFLYNTINSIQSFVLENDTKSSSNYLSRFAVLIRAVLENSRRDNITLAEEVEGLNNYIDFEAMRFPDKFHYRIEVDDKLDKSKVLLPPLLVQPYVENAIWHGLMHLREREGQLLVKFEKVDNHLKCTVDDNGIGRNAANEIRKKSAHKSVGLSIVAERMESMNKIYHWDMKVDIIDKTNENKTSAGTRVELFFPLIPNTSVYA